MCDYPIKAGVGKVGETSKGKMTFESLKPVYPGIFHVNTDLSYT